MRIVPKILESWQNTEGSVNSTEDLFAWIKDQNETTYVNINECSINDGTFWFYDDYNGEVLNRKRSFFSIKGVRRFEDGVFTGEQPIIVQPEIGYLGIICREINGTLNFLMQAKVEPGNVNCVQISPTIQATRSNFTRAHGGKTPTYFELFEQSWKYKVIYDQIQSEQATRFLKKRNRNMIMIVDDDIDIYPRFKWMTLGQIKTLMSVDNLVNMDTRTVLSGLPLIMCRPGEQEVRDMEKLFRDEAFFRSVFYSDFQETLPAIFRQLNDYKMFRNVSVTTVPLGQLVDWKVDEYGITCKKQADFLVRYYNIEISGREVQQWSQPLFKAIGMAVFGLLSRIDQGKRQYLIRIRPEIGSFDKVEIGPSIQWEPSHYPHNDNEVDKVFRENYKIKKNVCKDVILSEEGGRFFHEQNRNVILEIEHDALENPPEGYIWTDYATLGFLVQSGNYLNIQLRNLLSLIDL